MNSRRKMISAAVSGMSLVVLIGSAQAVVRNDNTVGTPLSEPGSVQITGSGYIGTGTIVGNGQWVLTAGHVASSMGGVGGTCTVTPMNAAGTGPNNALALTGTYTNVVDNSGNANITADWALIKLPNALPGAIPLAANNPSVGDTINFVGWGLSDPVAGSGLAGSPAGIPRQGQNVINVLSAAKSFMGFDFDLAGGVAPGPNVTYSNGVVLNDTGPRDGLGNSEATSFGGDSGMGYLETINGQLQLVGIHDGGFGTANTDQRESYGTPLSAFNSIIGATVPEPSSFSLVGLGSVALLARRRAARKHAI